MFDKPSISLTEALFAIHFYMLEGKVPLMRISSFSNSLSPVVGIGYSKEDLDFNKHVAFNPQREVDLYESELGLGGVAKLPAGSVIKAIKEYQVGNYRVKKGELVKVLSNYLAFVIVGDGYTFEYNRNPQEEDFYDCWEVVYTASKKYKPEKLGALRENTIIKSLRLNNSFEEGDIAIVTSDTSKAMCLKSKRLFDYGVGSDKSLFKKNWKVIS